MSGFKDIYRKEKIIQLKSKLVNLGMNPGRRFGILDINKKNEKKDLSTIAKIEAGVWEKKFTDEEKIQK